MSGRTEGARRRGSRAIGSLRRYAAVGLGLAARRKPPASNRSRTTCSPIPRTLSSDDGGAYARRRLSRGARHRRARRGAGAARQARLCLARRAQQAAGPEARDRRRRGHALRGRQDRRRGDHHGLPARAGRQPQAGRRRLHLRRQFQPHQESDGRQWRALSVARFFRLRRQGRGRGRGADRRTTQRLAGREAVRRLRLDGRLPVLEACRQRRASPRA